jgi:AcrR family transcriptional regulator
MRRIGKRQPRVRLGEPARLRREVRRDALLDTALGIVNADGADAVTMESVAEQAGVSRPLVYKHFANRDELLVALYRRETVAMAAEITAVVGGAGSLMEMHQRLIRESLRAAAERGPVFIALRSAGAWTRELRSEQRAREKSTVRAFASRAVRERNLDRGEATVASSAALGAVDNILAQWRRRPTPGHARLLEHIYLEMVAAAYAAVPSAALAPAGTDPVPAAAGTDGAELAPDAAPDEPGPAVPVG